MQIKVYTVDFRFPRWLKRTLIFAGVAAAVLVGIGASIRAATPVAVTTYADGETLSAAKLNTNLANLKQGIDDLQTALSGVQGQLTSGTGVKASSLIGGSVSFTVRPAPDNYRTLAAGANSGWFASNACDQAGETPIGGGCVATNQTDGNANANVYITASSTEGNHWMCYFKNVDTIPVTIFAKVVCAKATLTF